MGSIPAAAHRASRSKQPAPARRCARLLVLGLVVVAGCSRQPSADRPPSHAQPAAKQPTAHPPAPPAPTEKAAEAAPAENAPEAAPAHPSAEPAPAAAPLYSAHRDMMGTVFVISTVAPEASAAPAIEAAFDEIARLEDVLSEWIPTSEISRINQAAGKAPVHVSADTLAVVKAGLDVSRWSHGAFDLSWAVLRKVYDFRPGHYRVPRDGELKPLLPLIDYHAVRVDGAAQTVELMKRGMAIGTGGIGKGYALDRAGDVLRAHGIDDYMIFGGGQVQVHGTRGGRPWRVGIQHPRRNDYFAAIEASDVSISTSGDYEHVYVDPSGRRWHHIVDPKTGLPVEGTMSVTLIAPSGLYADALSTAVFVLGPKKGLAMLAGLPFEAEAVIVDSSCRVITTPGTEQKLHFHIALDDGKLAGCDAGADWLHRRALSPAKAPPAPEGTAGGG
ncbi:MAG: FAD:protein FMN transferase [Myxococcales bacterium]|nr:FAD:protein FMN transferase [Myxococcales bacterium]